MDEIKETGGATIGMFYATWPFATLIVTKDKLQLNVGIIGNLVFRPTDIVSIEPSNFFSLAGSGIRIIHKVENYSSKVIFSTMESPTALIRRIEETGFLNNSEAISVDLENEINFSQSTGSFPIKIPVAIGIVIIWNALFLMDIIRVFNNQTFSLGTGAQLALAFVFLTFLLLLISEPARGFALKPGRKVNDLKSFIYFTMFITGVIFFGITFMPH